MKFRIFGIHTPKPKRFTYRPRFYDEVAARHKQLAEQYAKSDGTQEYDPARMGAIFDAIRKKRKHPAESAHSTGLRIFIIALALCILLYILRYLDLAQLIGKIQNRF